MNVSVWMFGKLIMKRGRRRRDTRPVLPRGSTTSDRNGSFSKSTWVVLLTFLTVVEKKLGCSRTNSLCGTSIQVVTRLVLFAVGEHVKVSLSYERLI